MSTLKQRLLAGAQRSELLYVPEFETDECGGMLGDEPNPDCDGVVAVRPLTSHEQADVTSAEVSGQTVRGRPGEKPTEQQIDVATSARGQLRAQTITAAYGLSVGKEKWTPGEAGRLSAAAVRRIAAKVKELSGGDGFEEDARRFRGDAGGSADGDPAPDRDADRDEAG